MSSDDLLQRRLSAQVDRTYGKIFELSKDKGDQPFSAYDMAEFHSYMQDLGTANWASSQYTQFKFGVRKSIIDSIQ